MKVKSSPNVWRKKKEEYDVENLKLCREIRSSFDYLIHLIEKNKSTYFSALRKMVKKRKCEFGGKISLKEGRNKKYFYHFNFLMCIRKELEIISSENIPLKVLDDVDVMNITISYIHERISDLYLANLNLIKRVASRDSDEDLFLFSDLIAEGFSGIQKAAICFDEIDGGAKFSTFAIWWIKQSIADSMKSKYGNLIRKPSHVFDRKSFLKKKIAILLENGEPASYEALSEITKMSLKKIKEALQLREISLDMLFGDDGELIEFIPSDAPNPEEYFTQSSAEEAVCKLIGSLNKERDRIVISMRFGINGYKREHTLKEIGERFNLTRERIRQIEAGILRTLHFKANAMGLDLVTVF